MMKAKSTSFLAKAVGNKRIQAILVNERRLAYSIGRLIEPLGFVATKWQRPCSDPASTKSILARPDLLPGSIESGPMSDVQRRQSTSHSSTKTDVYSAWERFVRGDDDVSGVRPEVAVSWQRSRDQYRVDPFLSVVPAAVSQSAHPLDHDVAFTELGFRAAAIAHEVASTGGVVMVADANGRVMGTWGDKDTLALATESGLAPWFSWSEGAVGTNGMGTALESRHAITITQSEHWCQTFHDWSCGGIAVRDVVSKDPIAVLNISCWRSDLPACSRQWLEGAATHIQTSLRKRARDSGSELLAAYTCARAQSSQSLVAVDTAGTVVIADDKASIILGVPGNSPAINPAVRRAPQLPAFIQAARYATKQASADHEWTGSTQIFTPLDDEPSPIGIRPVFLYGSLIGHLISFGTFAGEQFPQHEAGPSLLGRPRRIVAIREEHRIVLLRTSEVAVAESDHDDVWLLTDDGRMRSAVPGLDKLDHELDDTGSFMRVHRQFVVNLNRIREVERREKGELTLVMDDPENTMVPVSRRNTRAVRRALGI